MSSPGDRPVLDSVVCVSVVAEHATGNASMRVTELTSAAGFSIVILHRDLVHAVLQVVCSRDLCNFVVWNCDIEAFFEFHD